MSNYLRTPRSSAGISSYTASLVITSTAFEPIVRVTPDYVHRALRETPIAHGGLIETKRYNDEKYINILQKYLIDTPLNSLHNVL